MYIKTKHLLSLLLSLLSFSTLSAQYLGMEELSESQLSVWKSPAGVEYAGAYHFGDSEDESTLHLILAGQKVFAQIRQGEWSEEGSWITTYRNLSNASIVGNTFFSDEYVGEFVYCETNGERRGGLKIRNSWSATVPEGKYEVGLRLGKVDLPGKYPEASTRFLTGAELQALSAGELQLMRNEIFARYGYRFKSEGKMMAHFSQTRWYTPQHKNVDDFLTEIEKANVALIRQKEKGGK